MARDGAARRVAPARARRCRRGGSRSARPSPAPRAAFEQQRRDPRRERTVLARACRRETEAARSASAAAQLWPGRRAALAIRFTADLREQRIGRGTRAAPQANAGPAIEPLAGPREVAVAADEEIARAPLERRVEDL